MAADTGRWGCREARLPQPQRPTGTPVTQALVGCTLLRASDSVRSLEPGEQALADPTRSRWGQVKGFVLMGPWLSSAWAESWGKKTMFLPTPSHQDVDMPTLLYCAIAGVAFSTNQRQDQQRDSNPLRHDSGFPRGLDPNLQPSLPAGEGEEERSHCPAEQVRSGRRALSPLGIHTAEATGWACAWPGGQVDLALGPGGKAHPVPLRE